MAEANCACDLPASESGAWVDDFVYMQGLVSWGVLTYTLHPFVIGRGHRMLMLERLIDRLQGDGGLFVAMGEAAKEFVERCPPG